MATARSANHALLASALPPLIAATVLTYAVHTLAWISHQLQGGGSWPRWLELLYLVCFLAWVTGLMATLLIRRHLRKTPSLPVLSDERTSALMMRAHQAALVVVVLAQVPFFVVPIPAPALAQLTVTTAVVVLFTTYAWLDR